MSMTKEQITAILAELDADLRKGAQEAEAVLRKAAEEDPESESVESKSSPESSSPAEEPAGDAAPGGEAPPPMADEAASAGGPPPDMGGSPDAGGEAPAGSGDPAADGGLTPEALQAEYAQLPPEELEMHIQAALAAKEALAGAAGAPGAASAPPAGGPAGAPPDAAGSAAPPAPMMGKNAKQMNLNPSAQGGKVAKSELDLMAVVKSQQEDIETLAKAVSTLLETPVRKSIAALSDVTPVKKSEGNAMSRKEVDQFIKENAPRMTKSERELWMQFVDNKVPAAKLAPMLERLSSK